MQSKNLLSLAILFFAMTQIVGFLLGPTSLFWFGKANAIAPLPIPFRESWSGYENYALKREYEIVFTDGSTMTQVDEEAIFQTFTGPHRRVVVFMHALGWALQKDSGIETALLDYVACRNNQLPFTKPITTLEIDYYNNRTGEFLGTIQHDCRA